MEFDYSDEQQAIQESLTRWLSGKYGFERRRDILRSAEGFSADAWSTYADMGLLALPLPESDGGLGGSGVDLALVMECFGKALVLEPYLSTVVLGAGLVAALGHAVQRAEILPAVASGQLKLALAHGEPSARYNRQAVATRAVPIAGGYSLNGHKAVVLGAPQADRLLVTARTSGGDRDAAGITVFLVDPQAPGVTLRAYAQHDGQRAADIRLADVTVPASAVVGPVDGAFDALDATIDRAIAALCAEAVGAMSALNAQTLDYLKTRHQFGVAIGSFQALQHRMADCTVAAEQARSMATLAAVKVDSPDAAERSRVVAGAKAYIGRQARHVGQEAIQMHGGMGLTDELVTSHYFKRLTLIDLAFGDSDHHFGRFSATLLPA